MTDTTTLIHVSRAELVALETLRYHFPDSTHMVTRSVTIRQRITDTSRAAASTVQAQSTADTTQTTHTNPLLAESKKKGLAWLCPLAVSALSLVFAIFLLYFLLFKKK